MHFWTLFSLSTAVPTREVRHEIFLNLSFDGSSSPPSLPRRNKHTKTTGPKRTTLARARTRIFLFSFSSSHWPPSTCKTAKFCFVFGNLQFPRGKNQQSNSKLRKYFENLRKTPNLKRHRREQSWPRDVCQTVVCCCLRLARKTGISCSSLCVLMAASVADDDDWWWESASFAMHSGSLELKSWQYIVINKLPNRLFMQRITKKIIFQHES